MSDMPRVTPNPTPRVQAARPPVARTSATPPAAAPDRFERTGAPPRKAPTPPRNYDRLLITDTQKILAVMGGGLGATIGLIVGALKSPVIGLTEAAAGYMGLGLVGGVAAMALAYFGGRALVRAIGSK